MIQMECDRCGRQEPVKNSTLPAAAPLAISREIPPPAGWKRVPLPTPEGDARKRDLCPDCLTELWVFMDNGASECVRCGHAPVQHRGADGCRALQGACGCELSEAESTDPGWADEPEEEQAR